MKIIFTGGGSGGHFYPIIAIAESIQKITKEKKLISPEMYFFAPSPYNQGLLYDHQIEYKKVTAGKMRRYFSILNFTDFFKTLWGILGALLDVFDIYPDVVFSKGGFGSVPTVIAARLLRIPVFIHESDSVPGLANKWTGKFATRIAISYKEAAKYFSIKKVAYTGQPVLEEKLTPITNGASEFFGFDQSVPTIFIIGGSQGAETINNAIMDILPDLVKNFQIIHQCGAGQEQSVRTETEKIIKEGEGKYADAIRSNYRLFPFLEAEQIKSAYAACDVVISRAGAGSIFEIAAVGKPAILIPIANSSSDHQLANAREFSAFGAVVVEEDNLTPASSSKITWNSKNSVN